MSVASWATTARSAPSDSTTVRALSRSMSATSTNSTVDVETSWRAARAPTAPAPTSATRTDRSTELGARQLAPSAALGRRPTGAAQAKDDGNDAGQADREQGATNGFHSGASKNRTYDLILIRDAL